MSVNFENAVKKVIEMEGGYNDIKEDRGGATNYGISLNFLRANGEDIDGDGDIDWVDVKNLTEAEAIALYKEYFWNPLYDQLERAIAEKVFTVGVNMGARVGVKLLQRALNVSDDGIIGNITIAATKRVSVDKLLIHFVDVQMDYYISIVKRRPNQIKFLRGWKNRAFECIK